MVKINENIPFYSNYDAFAFLTTFSISSLIYMISIINIVRKISKIKGSVN